MLLALPRGIYQLDLTIGHSISISLQEFLLPVTAVAPSAGNIRIISPDISLPLQPPRSYLRILPPYANLFLMQTPLDGSHYPNSYLFPRYNYARKFVHQYKTTPRVL